ncbi:hypothetical protein L6654_41705 [Bradyrhizobium sp. WYCCWR 13023]|uniref:Uncharacterized protein n=1 Tax=Bradyrhizobium zhengyangense TaxID=2911009 RepID=A0A9X1RLY6_9BRAD|nr:hypothetical protein [Bradyrhizobium zhengyangense]MCG2633069.1 hypothetical protein [Bradyrhizobium zhengyangense]MCG2668335.1 hypothetical protein [Bradyrhizobium zhengyangense]
MAKLKTSKAKTSSIPAVIVFGLDATGKPKAGRFPGKDGSVAKKAARALKLTFCNVNRPKLIEIATRIPVGRLHAQGKAFLPSIPRSLYDELASATTPSIAAAKASPRVSIRSVPKGRPKVFVVLGFDEDRKPRGARFHDPNEDQLIKRAADLKLYVFELRSAELISLAKSLPIGSQATTGALAVPEIKQDVYSEVIVEIADDEDAVPRGETDGPLPRLKGAPNTWDDIQVGHPVVAEVSPGYNWAEAIVIDRKDDQLTLRYRDYPQLPRFYRACREVALLSPKVQ